MAKLRELSYQEVIQRLRELGFRFYRHGKGSQSCGFAIQMVVLCQFRITVVKIYAKAPLERLFERWE